MPERYFQILSIFGTAAVIGFHCELPKLAAGWTAVVMFFVLAAIRMASAIDRDEGAIAYGLRRIRRFAPEFLCVYVVSLFVLFWWPSAGLRLFAITGLGFLQNWTRFLFEPAFQDLLFGPSWFLGALVQLQLVCLALRRPLRRLSASILFSGAVVIGVTTRLAIALAIGIDHGEIPISFAEAIYWTPFAHVESVMAGYLVGRGDWRALGRWMPAAVGAAALLGAIRLALSPDLSLWTLGYPLGLSRHFEFLWGYPVLAVAAASIASPFNPLRLWVDRRPHLFAVDRLVGFLAGLPYGVYLFHGAWILLAIQGLGFGTGRLLFLVAIVGSVLSAWLFVVGQNRLSRILNVSRSDRRATAANVPPVAAANGPAKSRQ